MLVGRIRKYKRRVPPDVSTRMISWTLHCSDLLWTWSQISPKATISTSDGVLIVILSISNLILIICILQHIIIAMMGIKPPSSSYTYPVVTLIMSTQSTVIAGLLLHPEVRTTPRLHNITYSATLLLGVLLCSYGIAYCLKILAKPYLAGPCRKILLLEAWANKAPYRQTSLLEQEHLQATTFDVSLRLLSCHALRKLYTPHAVGWKPGWRERT